MALKVCKFGGTSMADGNIIVEVKKIMESDKDRRFAVVSAPGKRYSGDVKVTDLLYSCQSELNETGGISKSFPAVRARFLDIARQLNLKTDIGAVLDETERRIVSENSTDFTASRGEYLSARVFAEVSGAKFNSRRRKILQSDFGSGRRSKACGFSRFLRQGRERQGQNVFARRFGHNGRGRCSRRKRNPL